MVVGLALTGRSRVHPGNQDQLAIRSPAQRIRELPGQLCLVSPEREDVLAWDSKPCRNLLDRPEPCSTRNFDVGFERSHRKQSALDRRRLSDCGLSGQAAARIVARRAICRPPRTARAGRLRRAASAETGLPSSGCHGTRTSSIVWIVADRVESRVSAPHRVPHCALPAAPIPGSGRTPQCGGRAAPEEHPPLGSFSSARRVAPCRRNEIGQARCAGLRSEASRREK